MKSNVEQFTSALDSIGRGRRYRINNAGILQIAHKWTMPDGTKIQGVITDRGFHLDRLEIPRNKRRQGLAKKWLATIGNLADQAGVALTGVALPDEGSHSDFHSKWVNTMRQAGFSTDFEHLSGLTGEPVDRLQATDHPRRDELIRHPRSTVEHCIYSMKFQDNVRELADMLLDSEIDPSDLHGPCPDCHPRETGRRQELEQLGWRKQGWGWETTEWVSPAGSYYVRDHILDNLPDDEWAYIKAATNAKSPADVALPRPKSRPMQDYMP